jgi:hypothetical protein
VTQKAIGLVGTRGHIPNVAFMDTADAMRAVGNNTGNLVFQYAVDKLITEPKLLIGTDTTWDVKEIREKCRVIVIPSANFIREDFDITGFVDFLDKVNLPLVFIGIGAQAVDYEVGNFNLHPSIVRLISLFKERSKLVSIRGEYTARVLDSLGVSNVEITGCPSNFINLSEDLPNAIEQKLAGSMRSFITHGDEPWPKNKDKQLVERRLARWTQQGAAMQSQQSVPSFMEYIRRGNSVSTAVIPEQREEALRRALMPEATLPEFLDFIAAKLRVYFSVHQWFEDSTKYDFSIGLRLHGNMVAWQAGTPALWIYHDSRTRELAEVMAVPKISLSDFLSSCNTIEDAWERVEFSKDAYVTRRGELGSRLKRVLDSENILSDLRLSPQSKGN